MTPNETRLTLFKKIKCPTCEGQTIDASNALMASDIRQLVELRLTEGAQEGAVLAEVQQLYGADVLVDSSAGTVYEGLWIVSGILGLFGLFWLIRRLWNR